MSHERCRTHRPGRGRAGGTEARAGDGGPRRLRAGADACGRDGRPTRGAKRRMSVAHHRVVRHHPTTVGAITSALDATPMARKGSRPCDLYAKAGTPCVAAFSSTRALFAGYAGPLYEVKRASDGTTLNIGVLARGGYANAAAQDAFCAGTSCVVEKIYDQTAHHNDLVPQGPTTAVYSNTTYSHDPVSASALPILAGGHPVYGLKFQSGSPHGPAVPHGRHVHRKSRGGLQQRSRPGQGGRGQRTGRERLWRLRRHLLGKRLLL